MERRAEMIKNYILDTNVLIHDPKAIYKFGEHNVIIPIICIEELDDIKNREGLVGFQARSAGRELDNLMSQGGNLAKGIILPNGGVVKVELNNMNMNILPNGVDIHKNDSKILAVTANIKEENKDTPTILVSKDLYMRVKGDSLGIDVQDYRNDKIETDELFSGYMEISMSSNDIDRIMKGGLPIPIQLDRQPYPNEFLHIRCVDGTSNGILARHDKKNIFGLRFSETKCWGLKPRNIEQKFAYELLMDDSVSFVSLTGGAGSGKTILSTAVGLEKVVEKHVFKKIVFVRPVVPAGKDIGFLPGTEEEKLRPWMGSFYDAIESLNERENSLSRNNTSDKKKVKKKDKYGKTIEEKPDFTVENFIEELRAEGAIEMKTFTYMRGRTLQNCLIIVDEAQELTPHIAKLMLTRVSMNSKIVFAGDPSDNQIDNIFVDSRSNGLVYAVEKMKAFDITGHMSLKQSERSPLAELAEKYL